ncbi:hypothetical protein MUP56_01985, partial [Patescibacteria group bacterium]|nr:hypothetical protein [Patescibacteria group bacterium]
MSQEIYNGASPLSAEPFNFSESSLADRDISQRFTDQEKLELSSCIQESWENLHQDRGYQEAKIISLRSEDFSWGKYPDGEAYALKQHGRLQTDNERNTHLYAAVNLEDGDDVLATQTILRKLKHPRTILGTAYFPYERGDRP